MPIQRFRDFDEARRSLWVDRDDPRLGERIRRLWSFSRRLVPERYTSGVTRFRTIEEANRDRDEGIKRRVARMRAARGG